MVWLNVGRRQRRLLFVLLARDEPRGRPIASWGAACHEFKIDYKPYILKSRQKEMFSEECAVKRSFERLVKRGFILSAGMMREGFSLTSASSSLASSSGGGVDFDFCVLTCEGRLVAERLKLLERGLTVKEEVEVVRQVLVRFHSLGYVYVTALQVRDFLWQDLHERFVSRQAFDKYWHNTKIGLRLRKYRVGRARVSKKDYHRKYCLSSMTLQPEDI